MQKINFEDAELVQNGYVMIDGVKHEITEAIYNGKIPLSAETLNKLQDNVEEAIGDIKAEDIAFTDGDTFQDKYDSGELKGAKGDKGDKGDTGEQGIKGDTGIPGTNGADGEDGFSPTITEKTNTDTEYVLTVTNKTGSFDTPNLKGQDGTSGSGEGGTTNYTELTNKPKINDVELSGNKTLDDLGIASKDSVTAVETDVSEIQGDVSTLQTDVTGLNIGIASKAEPPKSKTITLSKDSWVKNETTNEYEYNITDETITTSHIIEGYPDITNSKKLQDGYTSSYNGGYKLITSKQPTEDITMDITIQKTNVEVIEPTIPTEPIKAEETV